MFWADALLWWILAVFVHRRRSTSHFPIPNTLLSKMKMNLGKIMDILSCIAWLCHILRL